MCKDRVRWVKIWFWMYLVVHYQFDWCACSLLLRRCVHEHFVHILSMEHVVPTRRCLLIFNRPCNNLFIHIS